MVIERRNVTQAQTLSELHKAIASQYDLIAELEANVEAVKAGKQPAEPGEPKAPTNPPKRRGRTPGAKNKPKTSEDPGIDPEQQKQIDALSRDLDKR